MKDWIKAHPILSIMITFATSLIINVISSVVYDIIKYLLTK